MAYVGFKKLKGQLSKKPGIRNPGAVAASIGRKKYGAKKMGKMAAKKKTAPEMGYTKLPKSKVQGAAKAAAMRPDTDQDEM